MPDFQLQYLTFLILSRSTIHFKTLKKSTTPYAKYVGRSMKADHGVIKENSGNYIPGHVPGAISPIVAIIHRRMVLVRRVVNTRRLKLVTEVPAGLSH